MSNHIKPEDLDRAAKKNEMLKQKQLSEMVNTLRWCAGYFTYKQSDTKLNQIAERLQTYGFGWNDIKLASDKIIDNMSTFPSFSDILKVIKTVRPYQDEQKEKKDLEEKKIFDMEQQRLEKIRSEFHRLLGEDKVEPYIKWWLKNVLELDSEAISGKFPVPIKAFELPAMFDWCDSFFTNNFERIAQVGKEKMEWCKKNPGARQIPWKNHSFK